MLLLVGFLFVVHFLNWRFLSSKGHFTHETASPWPSHFNHSHWWKGGASQVLFTLRLRDQRSIWMQDGCKRYMDSYMASNGSCFMVTWTIFKNHLLEVGLTKIGRPWHSEHSKPLLYSIVSCMRTRMNRNLLKLHLVEGPITYDFTLHDHTTWFWRCLGRPLDTFFWALTNLMF